MNDIKVGCVADDFTGASDAASFLAEGGLATVLFNGVPQADDSPEDMQAAVVALKTRTQETASAVSDSMDAIRWLLAKGTKTVYIKYCSTFDSTPRGNIGPICDAAMEFMDTPFTVLCPSLPVNKRTVEDGSLYVDGVPLEQTHMSRHPITPMWDSCIPNLMKDQSKYPCYVLRRNVMEQGWDAVMNEIKPYMRESRRFYLIPDYTSQKDAKLIVSLFKDLPLLTGGSGLMDELAMRCTNGVENICKFRAQVRGSALILAGSCSIATRSQVNHFLNSGGAGIMLEPEKLLRNEQPPELVWEKVKAMKRTDTLIYSSGSRCGKSVSEGTEHAAALENAMANVARLAVADGVTRVIVAGGETSGAVTKALGLSNYQIGESIAPGVPVMAPLQNPAIRLVLKSGNFGQEDFFARALTATGAVQQHLLF